MFQGRFHFRAKAGLVVAVASLGLVGLSQTSQATAHAGPTSVAPASGTPQLYPNGTIEMVRQLVQCGTTMYAVGTFTEISQGGQTFARNNLFSFSATAPYTITPWSPNANGTVNSIAFNGTDCSNAYIGGSFTSVGGGSAKDIAEVDTSAGALVTTFAHSATGKVETLLGVGGHLLVGGYYSSINRSTTDPYMTSLSPVTGLNDGFVHLNISGNYQYFTGTPNNVTNVYNQSLSHSGRYDVVMGDFTSVGGLPRQQLFMLDLSTTPATVTGWTSPQWDGSQGESTPSSGSTGYPYECSTREPFYLQAAAWSADDSTIYLGATGYHPNGFPTGSNPRSGLCDSASAFPATINPPPQTNGKPGYVLSSWINYTGCDSIYAAAADAGTAYFAGHERWSENPTGCDFAGTGAVAAPGIEGLDPATGGVTFNPTRSRGKGADDMLVTAAGLWIASDNWENSATCGGVSGHAGICFLPYGP